MTVLECFERHFTKSDGCWEWRASRRRDGYGQFMTKRRVPISSHRMSWMLYRGEIPKGIFVLHSCDNRLCVNPSHLFLGTQKDNAIDMFKKDRGYVKSGVRNLNAKLTEDDVVRIRSLWALGETQKTIAEKFSVSNSLIYFIVYRKTWKDVI